MSISVLSKYASNQGDVSSLASLPDPVRRLVQENVACREKIREIVGIITRNSRQPQSPNGYIGATVMHQHHRIKLSPSIIGTHSPITIQLEFGRDVMDGEDVEVEDRVVKRRRTEYWAMDTS